MKPPANAPLPPCRPMLTSDYFIFTIGLVLVTISVLVA